MKETKITLGKLRITKLVGLSSIIGGDDGDPNTIKDILKSTNKCKPPPPPQTTKTKPKK